MAKNTRETWEKRIERWQDSGLTAREFSAEIGVNPHTLSHWKWRLNADSNQKQKKARISKHKAVKKDSSALKERPNEQTVDFIEVVTHGITQPEPFEVILADGVRVRIPIGFGAEDLRRLLQAVETR